jgi:hypothetical protein
MFGLLPPTSPSQPSVPQKGIHKGFHIEKTAAMLPSIYDEIQRQADFE